jgi:signal transduction histidine kinase
MGYDTRAATDGRRALELFDREPLDLVLLDLVMPGFDGLDVIAHLRAHPERSDVPIILLTGHSEREHRLRGIEAGADEFLEKPVDAAILKARIRMLLALKDSRDELKRSRDALSARNRELEVLQREQRELMEFLVHDLKNPLMVVSGNVEYLRSSGGVTGAASEALADASEAAGRLRTMVEDLLTVSRLESSQFPLRSEPIVVADLLRIVMASFERKAREHDVTLSLRADRGLRVKADTTLLQRVFENIVDNSFRYTPRAGRIDFEAHTGAGIEIAISNSGPAIPTADRSRIFEKFARLGDASGLGGSAGLGLYFCKRAVEAHAGHIDVTETQEWPTSFVIHLPSS